MIAGHFSIVITSCGRFDLLDRMLRTLFAFLDEAPARAILIEDSTNAAVRDVAASFPVEVIVNEHQLGQIASIDKAYAMVETPLVFHCEDDWVFTRGGFIGESRGLLDAYDNVAMVGLRARASLNPLLRRSPPLDDQHGRYFLTDPTLHPEYFSYSFNPGLRRMADYHRIGPFAAIGHEADISHAFKKAGFRMAYLETPAIQHLGDGRHVLDPVAPVRPSTMLQRLRRSVEKRIKRVSRGIKGH